MSIHSTTRRNPPLTGTRAAQLQREDGSCFGYELSSRNRWPRVMIACHGPAARTAFQEVLLDWDYTDLTGQLSLIMLEAIEDMSTAEIARFSSGRRAQHHVVIIEARDTAQTCDDIRRCCERLGMLKRAPRRLS